MSFHLGYTVLSPLVVFSTAPSFQLCAFLPAFRPRRAFVARAFFNNVLVFLLLFLWSDVCCKKEPEHMNLSLKVHCAMLFENIRTARNMFVKRVTDTSSTNFWREEIWSRPTLAKPTLANFLTDFGQSWS